MALFRNFCRILAAGTKARNHCSILRELYSDNCHIVRYMRPQESAVQGLGMTSLRESEGAKMKQNVFLPDDYTPAESEPFMNERQVEYFRRKLQKWKSELLAGSRDTIEALQDGTRNIPDVNDRASEETDRALELRTRDRQRKLVSKIDAALRRIDEGEFGYCSVTGEPISLKRLDARPIATMSLEAQEKHERSEKVHRDE